MGPPQNTRKALMEMERAFLQKKEKSKAQSQKPVGYAPLKKLRTLPDD